MSRKQVSFLFKILVSVAFGAVLWQVARKPEFRETIRDVDPLFVAASLAISALMVGVSCLKWWFLVRQQGASVQYRRLFRLYLVGYYFTCLLPSNIGGDVVRSYYVGREIGSQSDAAVTVFLERFTGLLLLLPMVILCPLLRPELIRHPAIWIPAMGAAGLLLTAVLLVRMRQPLKRLSELAPEGPLARMLVGVREKALGFHRKLSRALHALKRDPKLLVPVMGLSVVFYLLTWLNVYVSFRAFGVAVPMRDIVALLPTAMMVAMAPIAPLAGLGLAEVSYVGYFGLAEVLRESALAMGLLLRAKVLLLGFLGLISHLTLRDRVTGAIPSLSQGGESTTIDAE